MQLHDKTYLIVVDYFSRWIEVEHLERPDSQSVVDKLSEMFSKIRLPEVLMTDGGPQFAGALFRIFIELCD
jgi:hypothetical protein